MTHFSQPITIQGTEYGEALARVSFSELTTAATSQILTFAALALVYRRGRIVPANADIIGARVVRGTDFSGGGSAVVTVSVGDVAAPAELLSALDVFTGAKAAAAVTSVPLATPVFEGPVYAPQLTITSDVNVSLLDAGELEVLILYRAYTDAIQA